MRNWILGLSVFFCGVTKAATVGDVICYFSEEEAKSFSGPYLISKLDIREDGSFYMEGSRIQISTELLKDKPQCRDWYMDRESWETSTDWWYQYQSSPRSFNVVRVGTSKGLTKLNCAKGSPLTEFSIADFMEETTKRYVQTQEPRAGDRKGRGYISGAQTVSHSDCVLNDLLPSSN